MQIFSVITRDASGRIIEINDYSTYVNARKRIKKLKQECEKERKKYNLPLEYREYIYDIEEATLDWGI